MLGAVIGDIAGSAYEWNNVKTDDFEMFGEGSRFTDDTVMSCATAEAVLWLKENNEIAEEYTSKVYATLYKRFYACYPGRGLWRRVCKMGAGRQAVCTGKLW